MRGEHQADHGYLGLGSCGRTEVVQRPRENILHKQEEDKVDKIATDILPILETTTTPTLLDKIVFPSEETKVEVVEEEVNPLAREVYIEAYPVDILGDEENLNCLDELPTTETSDMLVRTADILEGLIPATDLEVLDDDIFETEVDNRLLSSPLEQTYFSAVESDDSAVFTENLDDPHEFPVINMEKEEDESSAQEATDGSAWHAPVTQENFVAPAKLVAHDCVVRDVNPGNEVEESERDQDSVSQGGSCISTELFETLAKSRGFEGAHDMDEQGTRVATDLAMQLNSQLYTKCVLSKEDSVPSRPEETLSHGNAGGMADTISWHTLLGVSPVYAIGVFFDGREPCNQDNHDDANESKRVDTSNNALHLLDSRKPGKKRALDANWEGPYQFIGHIDGKGNFDFEEGSRICIIQDADGRLWERSCRDLQIYHVQPD